MNKQFSPFISAYRESYNAQHVILSQLRLYGGCSDGSFDCIPHDLVTAKFAVRRFDKKMLRYIYSYLKKVENSVSL